MNETCPVYDYSQGITFKSVFKSCWLAVAELKGCKAVGIHQKHTFTSVTRYVSLAIAAKALLSKCVQVLLACCCLSERAQSRRDLSWCYSMGPLYNCSQGITFPIVSRSCWLAVAGSKGRKAGGIHQKHTFTKLRGCDST